MSRELFRTHMDEQVPVARKPPLISIIQQGRNDGHMGNFLYRLATSVNQSGRAIRELGAEGEIELLLCDWGSDHPLYQALELSPDAKRVLKIVTVSPTLAAKYNRDSRYSQVHPPNTAARRAQGDYLMYFDGDTYLPLETLRKLIEAVRTGNAGGVDLKRTLFGSSRYHIPKDFNTRNPTLEAIDRHVAANHSSYAHEKINTKNFEGATNGLSLPRAEFWRAQGFDESLIYWGWWDIEFYHRIRSQGFGFADWEDFGLTFYHLEHFNNSKNRSLATENPRRINEQKMPTQFAPNGENWGLNNERVQIISWTPIVRPRSSATTSGSAMTNAAREALESILPPQIQNDDFYKALQDVVRRNDLKTILEIGSSSGQGSTEAFVSAIQEKAAKPTLFCIEASRTRFQALADCYKQKNFVKCIHASSVPKTDFPSEQTVAAFYQTRPTKLNEHPLDQVLSWLRNDVNYVESSGAPDNGIDQIRQQYDVNAFDMVLIDGSEFLGKAELAKVLGSRFIALDDTMTYKNFETREMLLANPNYKLLAENTNSRNGWAIFERKMSATAAAQPGPRFSVGMIVFNAELFLEACLSSIYDFAHEILIVEGSCPQARWDANPQGVSRDRTLEIIRSFPDPQHKIKLIASQAWEHKDEMVNAYAAHVTGDYLFHVDSDEIWTKEALEQIRQILARDPSITCLEFNPLHFWHNFQTVTAGGHWEEPFMRIFKFAPGARWRSHEPPILLDPQGRPYNDMKRVNATRQWGLRFHHYSYLTKEQARWKGRFFQTYLDPATTPNSDTSTRIGPTRDWFEKVWLAWENDPKSVEQRYGTTPGGGPAWRAIGGTTRYDGPHPSVMLKHPLWPDPKRRSALAPQPAAMPAMSKLFVTPEQQVLEGADAERMLQQCNDRRFLSDQGIIQVDRARWEMAQRYEKRTWMVSALNASDDRNQEHADRFDGYRALGCRKFKNVIELGCGPFTNLRLILPHIPPPQHVSLLDPLIGDYLNHPHGAYRDQRLCGLPVETIASSIEQFSPARTYDMVVMINVLEHCYDIPKIFEVVLQLLAPKGVFIFADNVFRKEEIPVLISSQFDSGHPIRISQDYVTEFWDRHFRTLYQKTFHGLYDQAHRIDLYRIGEKEK